MAKSIQEEAWDWVALHSDWESGHDLRALVIRLADRIDELEKESVGLRKIADLGCAWVESVLDGEAPE